MGWEVLMRTSKLLPYLVICLTSIPVNPQQAKAKEKGEPQMVWVNYAEGEVKFSPGHNGRRNWGRIGQRQIAGK